MPFRERVKKAFGRSDSMSDGSSLKLKKTNTSNSSKLSSDPKAKYRGPVDPKHKERLEAFSFVTSNWRRKSCHSQYSPFGSKMPSRNNSLGTDSRKLFGRGPRHAGKVMQNVDDSVDFIGSRNHSVLKGPSSTALTDSTVDFAESEDMPTGAQEGSTGFAHDHTPFTEADVSTALEKIASKCSAS